jgi:hypothetical protein
MSQGNVVKADLKLHAFWMQLNAQAPSVLSFEERTPYTK